MMNCLCANSLGPTTICWSTDRPGAGGDRTPSTLFLQRRVSRVPQVPGPGFGVYQPWNKPRLRLLKNGRVP